VVHCRDLLSVMRRVRLGGDDGSTSEVGSSAGAVPGESTVDELAAGPGVLAPVSPAPRWSRTAARRTPGPTARGGVRSRPAEGQHRGTSAALHWISTSWWWWARIRTCDRAACAARPGAGMVTVVGELATRRLGSADPTCCPFAVPPGSPPGCGVPGLLADEAPGRYPRPCSPRRSRPAWSPRWVACCWSPAAHVRRRGVAALSTAGGQSSRPGRGSQTGWEPR